MSDPVHEAHTGRFVCRRALRGMPAFVCAAALTGCSIAGTWKTITIDPPGAAFPVDTVTFDRDGSYTATSTMDGRAKTTVGRYRAGMSKLEILQPGNRMRTYGLQRRLDGSMLLIFEEGQGRITATLHQSDEQP